MGALPQRLFRVDAKVGYGWPERYEQREEHRTFATAQGAADWVASLQAVPSHHHVISVHRTDTQWVEVPLDMLPLPKSFGPVVRKDETCVLCGQPIDGAPMVGMWDGDEPTAVAHAECPKVDA